MVACRYDAILASCPYRANFASFAACLACPSPVIFAFFAFSLLILRSEGGRLPNPYLTSTLTLAPKGSGRGWLPNPYLTFYALRA